MSLTPTERDMLRTIVLLGLAIPADFTGEEAQAIESLKARRLIDVTPLTRFIVATQAGRAVMAKAIMF